MNILIEEHREMLRLLCKQDVSFVIIGGYAVIYHGYERTTGDIDIWLQPTRENFLKLKKALTDFGIEEADLESLNEIDPAKANVFFFGEKPRQIDFLTKVSGVTFDDAAREAEHFQLDEVSIPVLQLQHLVLTKMTGRLKDAADIDELQRIDKHRTRG
jgi:hypothetical protein